MRTVPAGGSSRVLRNAAWASSVIRSAALMTATRAPPSTGIRARSRTRSRTPRSSRPPIGITAPAPVGASRCTSGWLPCSSARQPRQVRQGRSAWILVPAQQAGSEVLRERRLADAGWAGHQHAVGHPAAQHRQRGDDRRGLAARAEPGRRDQAAGSALRRVARRFGAAASAAAVLGSSRVDRCRLLRRRGRGGAGAPGRRPGRGRGASSCPVSSAPRLLRLPVPPRRWTPCVSGFGWPSEQASPQRWRRPRRCRPRGRCAASGRAARALPPRRPRRPARRPRRHPSEPIRCGARSARVAGARSAVSPSGPAASPRSPAEPRSRARHPSREARVVAPVGRPADRDRHRDPGRPGRRGRGRAG